VFGGGEEIAG
jgi:hypothetical protein